MEHVIKIILWGVRGSTPCANSQNMQYGGNTTCVEIDIPGHEELLVFDCGTGFRNLGNTVQDDDSEIKGRIFLTHPHWDHLQGFPFFKPFYSPDNWFRIYLPPQEEMGCREILQGHMSKTFFPVSMDMLEANIDCQDFHKGVNDFGDFSVEYMWANHTVPTAIYKMRSHGRSIVFAPDNEILEAGNDAENHFNDRMQAFLEDVDVLIHDAQYTQKQYETKKGWGHSAWENTVDLAAEAGVKQLCLTHHDPDHEDAFLSEIEEKVLNRHQDSFEEIWLAKEGQEIILPCEKTDKISEF